MANIFSDIAVSPSGTTLLNAVVVTTTAGTVLNEVVTLGDASNPANVGSVLASGAMVVASDGVVVFPVSGTVTANQATAANLNATVVGTVTANAGTGTLSTNIAQIAATAVVSASAGVMLVGTADGSGNKLTSNSTTQSRSIDVNVVSALGVTTSKTNPIPVVLCDSTNALTAALSAWGVAPTGTEVEGVNSNVFIAGTIAAAAAAGVQQVGITGHAGATLDAATGGATAPTNNLAVGAIYKSTPSTPSANQQLNMQCDYHGSLFVKPIRRSDTVGQATTIASSSSATTVMAAQASGVFADISSLIITLTGTATNTASTATLSDGTISYIFDLNTGATTSFIQGSILNLSFNPPIPASSAATAWTVALSASTITAHITVVAVLQKAS